MSTPAVGNDLCWRPARTRRPFADTPHRSSKPAGSGAGAPVAVFTCTHRPAAATQRVPPDHHVGAAFRPPGADTAAPRRQREVGPEPRRAVDAHHEAPQHPHARALDGRARGVAVGDVLQVACDPVQPHRRVAAHVTQARVTGDRDHAPAFGPRDELVFLHGATLSTA